ncbi:MAG: nucleoside-diphosphate kinase [Actinomycetaceae bacterium]|nr:nucleoside-diphosphate kinase [Actinomycetaceae bacterium]
MVERTLALVKPDAYARGLTGQILARIEAKGYKLVALSVLTPTSEQLSEHYAEHAEKPFFGGLVQYMSSGPAVAIIVEGHRCIEGMRTLAGSTDPTTAAPGTIRGDFGRDWGTGTIENIIHCSDSPAAAKREIGIWFPGENSGN